MKYLNRDWNREPKYEKTLHFRADLLIISGDTVKCMSPVCGQPAQKVPELEPSLDHYPLFRKKKKKSTC